MTDNPLRDATIVFDLDGTLIDTAPDLTNALNDCLAICGYAPVAAEAVRAAVAHGARAMIEEGLVQAGASEDAFAEPKLDAMLANFLKHYEAHIADDSLPFEGALEALTALEDAGATLAICTNKREALARQLLETLGLDNRFAVIAGRDSFAAYKPDPLHLTSTVRAAGGDIGRAVMVGDSEVDIRTGKAAGIPVVAVTFGYGAEETLHAMQPEAIIGHYRDLVTAAASLIRPGTPLRKASPEAVMKS